MAERFSPIVRSFLAVISEHADGTYTAMASDQVVSVSMTTEHAYRDPFRDWPDNEERFVREPETFRVEAVMTSLNILWADRVTKPRLALPEPGLYLPDNAFKLIASEVKSPPPTALVAQR